jgi:hypothetical protein
MKSLLSLIIVVNLFSPSPLSAESNQRQLNATFQTFVDEIKRGCRKNFSFDEQKFRFCSEERYSAMRSFFEKLFRNRDSKGIRSKEFKLGTNCINKNAPTVTEIGRKVAVEKTDWISANQCYESALHSR